MAQSTVLAIAAGALALFAWGRWRHDVVAVLALIAAVLGGVVPAGQAFAGFADPAVAAFAALLIVGAAIRHSGLLELPFRLVGLLPRRTGLQVGVLSGFVAVGAAFMTATDAFAAVRPSAEIAARRAQRRAAPILVPVAFAALLGGLATLIGTLPNLLASALRRQVTGEGFRAFDFAPVGAALAAAGVVVLALGWRLLPRDPDAPAPDGDALRGESYASEVLVPAGSPIVGQTIGALQSRGRGDVAVTAIIREEHRRLIPRPDWQVEAGDILVLACEPDALQRLMERSSLDIVGGRGRADRDPERVGVVEAVVAPGSELIGLSAGESRLDERFRIGLLAIGRHGGRPPVRLRRTKLRAGDVLVFQGELDAMPATLSGLGCLPLAERRLRLGRRRRILVPALAVAGAVALSAAGVLPIALGLVCAVVVLVVARIVTAADLYGPVVWPAVVLAGALLPVSAALRTTGTADLAGGWLVARLGSSGLPPGGFVVLALLGALVLTPVCNGVAAVLLLGPVALSAAARLGVGPDPFLMAVAVGASCDLLNLAGGRGGVLTPGWDRLPMPGAWRIGLPLTLMVALLGAPLILLAWPLRP